MSLSVGGYECGYTHPAGMGLSSASQSYYGGHGPSPLQGYTDFNERDFYNNWVLSAAGTQPEMSAESYGSVPSTPSPTCLNNYGYSVSENIQQVSQWRDYQMNDSELAIAHNIPLSELGQYESYTNVYGDRCLRRRTSANRKERRRTLSINNAFSNLRCSIPNVPSDTKLSKIKTLRLAISYISYLNEVLEKGDPELAQSGFKADVSRKRERRTLPTVVEKKPTDSCESDDSQDSHGSDAKSVASTEDKNSINDNKTAKGRTGWPQEVWASELRCSPTHIATELSVSTSS
ncbi:Heart- and neural crest derivatives-expressed protein 2 [Mactra antiquata]